MTDGMKNTMNDSDEYGGKDLSQVEYEMAIEMLEYCEMYEPTYNPEDGSM